MSENFEQSKSQQENHANTSYIFTIAGVAALGGLLFGYDTAVISGAIGFMQSHFQLNDIMKGWAASCALIGCMIGAATAGFISDRFGRKSTLILSAVLFILSALGCALSRDLNEFIVSRVLGGIGIGIASMLSPMYIAEVSPAKIRGSLVTMNQFTIVFGMFVVYWVNSCVAGIGNDAWNIDSGWRWMFGSGVIPAVFFFGLLFFVPESPRWLSQRGREDEALDILTKVGGAGHAQKEMKEIRETIAMESGTLSQLFEPKLRIVLFIGIGLAVLQQITGINVILYYAPEIFKSMGIASGKAINDTVIIGFINMSITVVAFFVVDLLGRKLLLLLASAGMGLSLALLGSAFFLQQFTSLGGWMGVIILGLILFYVASFALAMGPVVWVVISEIFPNRIRGRAMSISVVCLWFSCYLVSQFFPIMLAVLKGNVFFIYAAMSAVSFLFVLFLIPETKGKTLEEIEHHFMK